MSGELPTPPPTVSATATATVTMPDITALAAMYKDALVRYVTRDITRNEILLVIARFLLNKAEFCDDDCKEDANIHFHDVRDWTDGDEFRALRKFWKRSHSDKANRYVDEIVEFARVTGPKLATMIGSSAERYFQMVVKENESAEFLQGLVDDHAEIISEFPFQCAAICMLLDMHAEASSEAQTSMTTTTGGEKNWFETFFELFLDDYAMGDDDDDDTDSDDDTDEDEESAKPNKSDSATTNKSESTPTNKSESTTTNTSESVTTTNKSESKRSEKPSRTASKKPTSEKSA